jgi:hypothetical protein
MLVDGLSAYSECFSVEDGTFVPFVGCRKLFVG